MKKRILSYFICLGMMLSVPPTIVLAIEEQGLDVIVEKHGKCSWEEGVLKIKNLGEYTISGKSEQNRIEICLDDSEKDKKDSLIINISNLNISSDLSPIYINNTQGHEITINIIGINSLTSTSNAGIKKDINETLIIEGRGSLDAYGGEIPANGYASGFAGIEGSNITINCEPPEDKNLYNIKSTGNFFAAGIGGGYHYGQSSDGENIRIINGKIIANGGSNGAGIGGGYGGSGNHIEIINGCIVATGGYLGAGIGGGACGGAFDVTIGNGTIIAEGKGGSAGIGSGSGSNAYNNIQIFGGNITSTGSTFPNIPSGGGAGIGSGCIVEDDDNISGTERKIIINGGNIKAYGGAKSSGIGGSGNDDHFDSNNIYVEINGGNIEACGDKGAASIGGGNCDFGNIKITSGEITVTNSDEKEGIGIGGGKGANVEISGGKVLFKNTRPINGTIKLSDSCNIYRRISKDSPEEKVSISGFDFTALVAELKIVFEPESEISDKNNDLTWEHTPTNDSPNNSVSVQSQTSNKTVESKITSSKVFKTGDNRNFLPICGLVLTIFLVCIDFILKRFLINN